MPIKLRAVAQCEWCGKEQDFLANHILQSYSERPPGWERTNAVIAQPELLCPNCHDRYTNGGSRYR